MMGVAKLRIMNTRGKGLEYSNSRYELIKISHEEGCLRSFFLDLVCVATLALNWYGKLV